MATDGLTPRESRFLRAYMAGSSLKDAWLIACPTSTNKDPSVAGWKMLRRIKAKVDWEGKLAEAGLDDLTLLRELRKRLRAKSTHFYQDMAVSDVEDNGTRMRATELLADLLGRRRAELTLHHDVVQVIPAPLPAPAEPEDPAVDG